MFVFPEIHKEKGYINIAKYNNISDAMGKTMVILPNALEREFRAKVAMIYGGKKGALGLALKEAVELWLKQHK